MSKESVEKGEMEVEWSEATVEHASEVDTYCKLLTKVQTSVGCAEELDIAWAARTDIGPRHTGKPGKSARVKVDPDLLVVGERERSECDMVRSNPSEDDQTKLKS